MMMKEGENNYEMEIKTKTFKICGTWKIVSRIIIKNVTPISMKSIERFMKMMNSINLCSTKRKQNHGYRASFCVLLFTVRNVWYFVWL